MKIAIVCANYYSDGGAEVVMLGEIGILAGQNHQISVFSRQDKKNLETPYSKYFIEQDYIDIKKQKGLSLNALDKIYYLFTSVSNYRAKQKFEKFLKDVNPDLVHIHNYSRYITPTVYECAKKYNIPVITTEHSTKLICPIMVLKLGGKQYCKEKKCIRGNYWHSLINKCIAGSFIKTLNCAIELGINKKRYIKNTDKIIVPSLYLKNLLIETGISEEKIIHIPNFVNLEKFNYSPFVGDYFLYYGRLAYEKGLLTLIKAFENLPNLNLKIVGEGPEEKTLKNYIKEKNIKNIEFIGRKDWHELEKIIQNSKATILPSECGETFGLTIVESFACRKPVIASNVGGIPEVVSDNVDGSLFESGNIKELSQTILKLTQKSNQELIEMGKLARKKVEDKYTLEKHCEKLIQVYKSVLP